MNTERCMFRLQLLADSAAPWCPNTNTAAPALKEIKLMKYTELLVKK